MRAASFRHLDVTLEADCAAAGVRYPASDEFAFMTGAEFVFDGGLTAGS